MTDGLHRWAQRRSWEEQAALYEITAALPALDTPAGHRLILTFFRHDRASGGLARLRAVTDGEFLTLPMCGPGMLALLRSVVPAPVPAPKTDIGGPWSEHAEMLALVPGSP